MSTSAAVRILGIRRCGTLLAGVLVIVVAAAGTAFWLARPSLAPPIPPLVPLNQTEPEVTAFIEKSRERVLKETRSARAWGVLGQAFIANDMEDESLVCFAEAERLDPNNPRWPYYQAGTLINRGEREAALAYLRRSVELCRVAEPDNRVPRLWLAETLLILGQVEEAESHFRQVLDQQPEALRAHYDLALTAAARQDWDLSRTHLLSCLGSPFAQQKASVQLATVCLRLGDRDNAEKFRQQANRLPLDQEWVDPFVTEYLVWAVKKRNRYRHAESLEGSGRLREAADVLRPMVAEFPNDYLPRVSLGKILGRLGDHRGAEQILREALRLAPEKVQVHYYLSLILYTQADDWLKKGDRGRADKLYREAVQLARETIARKSDYGFAYMTLGMSLKSLGQKADALSALQQAVLCNPEHAELHFYLGEMLADNGRRSEALNQLEQAVQMGRRTPLGDKLP